MADPMCPAEVMLKARFKKWHPYQDWSLHKEEYTEKVESELDDVRLMLRALAEMEPTENMIAEAYEAANQASFRPGSDALIAGCKAYNLQASKEGESS